jgi:hypothetical protein
MDHTTRLQAVVKDALKDSSLLGEKYGYNLAQGLVLHPEIVGGKPTGGTQLTLGWNLIVSMRHPLLGYPDIALAAPVPMTLPPDHILREMSAALLEAVRAKRDEELKSPRQVAA